MKQIALALALAAGGGAHAAAPSTLDQVAWLAGCWELTDGDRRVEEQWTSPRAGIMLGVGRTARGDRLVEFEFVELRERDGRLEYRAHPSGQAPAPFLSARVSDTEVVFENPEHDFPQRVAYRRDGADRLLAWIEGRAGGETRRREFPYQRVGCAGAAAATQRSIR